MTNSMANQEFALVPDGVGGLTVDIQPKGRKNDNSMFGSFDANKLTEEDYVLASIGEHGQANAFLPDGKVKCITGDYRSTNGLCKPIPVTGSDQYLPYLETNAFVPRKGLFGGSNRVIRVPDEQGRLRTRQITSRSQGNALMEMLSNPGTEASGAYYDANGTLRNFYPTNHYSKANVPDGYVVGPNNMGVDGRTETTGRLYSIYDTAAMARDGLKLGRLADGRYAATPKVYKDGNSQYGVSPPMNFNIPSGLNFFGGPTFPPVQRGQVAQLPALDINNFRSVRNRRY